MCFTWLGARHHQSVLSQAWCSVGLFKVSDVRVDPTAYFVMSPGVNVDTDTVVNEVPAYLETQLDRVELVQPGAAR